MVSSVYFLTAYLLSMKEVSKYTSSFQFAAVFLSGAALGFGLDQSGTPVPLDVHGTQFPLFTITLLLCAAGSLGRMIFFRTFGYTRFAWFEPVLFILTMMSYLAANALGIQNWAGWVFPLPVLFLQAVLAFGILKDKSQLLSFTKGGYKISIGTEAPDFTLPDQGGQSFSLSSLRGSRHILLIFVRGDWCPGCHMMLRTYQRESARFREKNVYAMAIGPDPIGVNREMVEKLGLEFKVLSDEKQRTAMTYGVQLDTYDNDFAEKYEEGIPLPASFLVDKNGIVRYISRPDRVGEFLDPRTIFPIIDKLN
jgi:peroxiredoxin